jgi:hypothetical protein
MKTADWEELVRAVVDYGARELAIALELCVATISKISINPNPVYIHVHT